MFACTVFLSLLSLGLCASKPNIVFILADDFGFNDVGYHSSEIRTPNIDQLAGSGVRLENYYVQPICTPTRSQLMTGRYQIHTGLQHGIIWAQQPNALPKQFPTMADGLRREGYSTNMVGKWHLGFYKEEFLPYNRGFDTFYGYLTGSEDYYTHTLCDNFQGSKHCGLDLRSETSVDRNQTGHYSAHMFTERAVNVIKKHKDSEKPMFLYMAYQSVHDPLQAPEEYIKPYQFIKDKNRRIFAGMAAAMDEGIGNLTRALKDAGLYENTIIIFSNDNGAQIHSGGNNWPLRGWKYSLWEGGIRGVGFVHSPLLDKSLMGSTNRELLHVSDWFPTVMHLAGAGDDPSGIDGINAWPSITNSSGKRRTEILHNIDPLQKPRGSSRPDSPFNTRTQAAIRVGPWKLLTGDPGNSSWIPPPQYLEFNRNPTENEQQNIYLFNIDQDPEERNEVSAEHPDIVEKLLGRLAVYNTTAVPVLFPANDPAGNPERHGGVWSPWR